MDIWREHFPDKWQEIAGKRAQDHVLDSICRDFELLLWDQSALPADADHAAFQLQAYIRETLEALSKEICLRLADRERKLTNATSSTSHHES